MDDGKCYCCKKSEYDKKFYVQDSGPCRNICHFKKYFCSDKCMKKHIDDDCCQICYQTRDLEK